MISGARCFYRRAAVRNLWPDGERQRAAGHLLPDLEQNIKKLPLKGRMPGTCVPGIVMKKLFVSLLHWRHFELYCFSLFSL